MRGRYVTRHLFASAGVRHALLRIRYATPVFFLLPLRLFFSRSSRARRPRFSCRAAAMRGEAREARGVCCV